MCLATATVLSSNKSSFDCGGQLSVKIHAFIDTGTITQPDSAACVHVQHGCPSRVFITLTMDG